MELLCLVTLLGARTTLAFGPVGRFNSPGFPTRARVQLSTRKSFGNTFDTHGFPTFPFSAGKGRGHPPSRGNDRSGEKRGGMPFTVPYAHTKVASGHGKPTFTDGKGNSLAGGQSTTTGDRASVKTKPNSLRPTIGNHSNGKGNNLTKPTSMHSTVTTITKEIRDKENSSKANKNQMTSISSFISSKSASNASTTSVTPNTNMPKLGGSSKYSKCLGTKVDKCSGVKDCDRNLACSLNYSFSEFINVNVLIIFATFFVCFLILGFIVLKRVKIRSRVGVFSIARVV